MEELLKEDKEFKKTLETLTRYGLIINVSEGEIGTRPSWEEYFMAIAIDVASRSSCKYVNAGCVISDPSNNIIIGSGYNGAASGFDNCLDVGCQKDALGLVYEESLNSGNCEGVHAEMNAVGNLTKRDNDKGINVTNTIFPCHTCAKNLKPYGLQKILFKGVYSTDEFESTVRYLKKGNVRVERLNMSPERWFDIGTRWLPTLKFGVWEPEERERILEMKKKFSI